MKRRGWTTFFLFVLAMALPVLAVQKPSATPPGPAADGSADSTLENDGTSRKSGGRPVVMLVINGGINPATADYIHEGIERARAGGAEAVLIQMDTPGGLLDSTKSIVKEILGSPVPVIVYVAPSGAGAISAGVFVTMAAHVAVMAPGTNIGAAHPVAGQG
jgi:membrane-bound ClpP family serine protease